MVLHFSGYGYAPRGVCFWLLAELGKLRAALGDRLRLVVVFHESYAFGPPWRSAFWVMPMQALIARRLARMADALWTNTEHHERWLRGVVGAATPIRVRPVFSNVGEPEHAPNPGDRYARAVVFGLAATRQRVFDALRAHTAELRRLGIEELVEVGPGGRSDRTPAGFGFWHAGRLEGDALRRLLQTVRFGLLHYPPWQLSKSGVFAAYASHGCVVLNTCRAGPAADGLVQDRDYLSLPCMPSGALTAASHTAMGRQLTQWYAGHRLGRQAEELMALARGQAVPDSAQD